ncbi:hypothetical protein COL922a_013305 [Colletotrichum nupharicola]|nr:hypothetical protein COL922a_013305 [Colletotrichum nupharicola]
MRRPSPWLAALCGLATLASCETRRYSTWMLDSIKTRNQGIESSGASSSTLESGILAIAMEATIKQYPDLQSSYLDGIFSVLPFMAAQPHPNYTDISLQVSLLYEHTFQKNTSLVAHGYDYSRTAVWANEKTGSSLYVWGRSVGWFVAGLVQTWETLDCAAGKEEAKTVCKQLSDVTTQLSTALPKLGIYSESPARFERAALRAYNYTVNHFVTDPGNGTIGFDKTVTVCSLNSTATYEYYTNQPLSPNSLLGESAFVLASLEVERK